MLTKSRQDSALSQTLTGLIAAGVLGAMTAFPTPASASEWGCTVLLCLANPAGPKAVSQCVPPINKLFEHLAKGRAFPTCAMASAPNGAGGGSSYAKHGWNYYDPCPAGTTELRQGVRAVVGTRSQARKYYANGWPGTVYVGIGDGDQITPSAHDDNTPMPDKVCVGKHHGWIRLGTQGDHDAGALEAEVFSQVITMQPHKKPRWIDVYIDDQWYRRVRW